MNKFLRALSVVLLAAPFALSIGCSGGDGGGAGGSGSTSDTTAAGPGSTSASTSAGPGATAGSGNPASTGSGPAPISWSGTWNVHLQYSVDCDYSFGNIKHADLDQTNAMQLNSNGNGGLTADIMSFAMSGTGNATSLSLSGQYPVQDEGSNVASNVQADNNITLSITDVAGDNNASGAVSGKFVGNFGQKCTIATGTATLSR
jgi:hypothetical protein